MVAPPLLGAIRSTASTAATAKEYRYDAFISYSHDERQRAIAIALQRALQAFAKPFWKRGAVTLFRDESNLSANPDLWGMIEEALGQSRFLILIASPKAAASKWVAKEIEWWLAHRAPASVLIVLAAGSVRWEGNAFSESGTNALPAQLLGAFPTEPLWVDLSGVAAVVGIDGWQLDERFTGAVASLAARLRGVSKDELYGEDLHRHRQTRRAIATAIVSISLLLALATGAAIFANEKRKEAELRSAEAVASSIWSRIDFEGWNDPTSKAAVRALWDLAASEEAVRDAFLRQMGQDEYQVITLAEGPDAIARAFGLRPSAAELRQLQAAVLGAITRSTDPGQLTTLAQAVPSLGYQLAPNEARAALEFALETIPKSHDPELLDTLGQIVQTLGPELAPERARKAFDLALDFAEGPAARARLEETERPFADVGPSPEEARDLVALTLRVLPEHIDATRADSPGGSAESLDEGELSPEQAQAELTSVFDAILATTSPVKLFALHRAIEALGTRLAPGQAPAALTTALTATLEATVPGQILALGEAVRVLAPAVPPAQAEIILAPVLDAILRTTNRYQLAVFGRVVRTLGPELSAAQARSALTKLLHGFVRSSDTEQLSVLADTILSLGPTPQQVRAALAPVLDAITRADDQYQLRRFAELVGLLGPSLAPDQAGRALEVLQAALSGTGDPRAAAALSGAIAALLAREPEHAYVSAVATLLKWPTTAGPATDVLLDALQRHAPSAPGDAGLTETVSWIANTYPDIDLDSPPTYPASASTGDAR